MKLSRVIICHLAVIFISATSLAAPILDFDEIRIFDSYAKLSWTSEKLRLGAVAATLKEEYTKEIAYLRFHGGRRNCLSKARERAIRAKNYLVKERNIPAERIVLIEGGYYDEITIEVYIQPPGLSWRYSPTLKESEMPKNCNTN